MKNYTIIRSDRKSISINVTSETSFEVRAPYFVSKSEIESFVESSTDWIIERQAGILALNQSKAAFKLDYNDTVMVMGKKYPITAKDGNRIGFDGECLFIPPGIQPEEIKQAVIQVYKALAKNVLTNKVINYSKTLNVVPLAVKISNAKTRWGSCSHRNSLNFSWTLIMADHDAIDYVVVHELSHILEHNHSHRFWTIIARILPDYKLREAKLKELHEQISREDWY